MTDQPQTNGDAITDTILRDLMTKRASGGGNMIVHMVMDDAHGEIMRLRTALTASIAREAAAVEVAAVKVDGYANVWNDRDINGSSISVIARDVRRSTPADAQAALQAMIDAAKRRGMLKAIAAIDANISPCVPPSGWADDEINAYRCGQIDASVSFIHAIRGKLAKIGGAL